MLFFLLIVDLCCLHEDCRVFQLLYCLVLCCASVGSTEKINLKIICFIGPMIDPILAVCQTKDDQHTWVELLKQQIRTVHKSSVSSPSPATSPPPVKPHPLPPPHVSLHRASPYSELTAFFADLVQRGVITRKILKCLLYAQFKEDGVGVNILGVKVRRSHKVECVIFPTRVSMGTYNVKQTWLKSCTAEEESDENDDSSSDAATNSRLSPQEMESSGCKSGRLERQNAVDYGSDDRSSVSSCASNPFGFVHYYSPKCDDSLQGSEGFADGMNARLVESDCGSVGTKSDLPEDHITPQEKSEDAKFGSTLVRCKQKGERSPCLLATGQSSESSFERTSAHRSFPCVVCEDLTQLDEVILKEPTEPKGSCPQARQSLPVFGHDNFCRPEPAPLYVPSCHFTSEKDLYTSCHGVCLNPKPQLSYSMPVLPQEPYSPATTHSSSLNIPANVIPVPTAVLAELLYNLEPISDSPVSKLVHQQESASSDHSVESIQTVRDIPTSVSVTSTAMKRNSDFSKPCFKTSVSSPGTTNSIWYNSPAGCSLFNSSSRDHHGMGIKPSVRRRCYSYHYISIVENNCTDTDRCTNTEHCRCCGEVLCSSRSSDSGLADIAGNSTLPSPDMSGLLHDQDAVMCCLKPAEGPGNCLGVSSSETDFASSVTPRGSEELDEQNYEAQCVCTSPFGSTPRTSAQASLTSEKICVGSVDSVAPSITSTSLDRSPLPAAQPWSSSSELKEARLNVGGIYRSGMYAHWWLKTKIPALAVRSEESTYRHKTYISLPQTGKASVLKLLCKILMESTVQKNEIVHFRKMHLRDSLIHSKFSIRWFKLMESFL